MPQKGFAKKTILNTSSYLEFSLFRSALCSILLNRTELYILDSAQIEIKVAASIPPLTTSSSKPSERKKNCVKIATIAMNIIKNGTIKTKPQIARYVIIISLSAFISLFPINHQHHYANLPSCNCTFATTQIATFHA